MPRGYWGLIGALVGCLTALQAEASAPTAKGGPTVASQSERRASEQQQAQKPVWHRTIAEAEKAAQADCGTPQECRAEQRNYSDLRAQWKAADAAHGAKRQAIWQSWIAGIGVGLLLLTLWFTMLTSRRQLRAYVHFGDAEIPHPKPITRESRLWFTLRNAGLTQALDLRIRRGATFAKRPIGDVEVEFGDLEETLRVLPPTTPLLIHLDMDELSENDFKRMEAGEVVLWRLRVDYRTVFRTRDYDEQVLFFSADELRKGSVGILSKQERERA